jgi:hypothetical protein
MVPFSAKQLVSNGGINVKMLKIKVVTDIAMSKSVN